MAKDALDPSHLTNEERVAGADYLRALRRLGFEPDVCCWTLELPQTRDAKQAFEKHLALVSSLADRVGSRAIYELLFKAFDSAATPREIDPFNVSLYSPASAGGMALLRATTREHLEETRRQMMVRQGPTPEGVSPIMVMPGPEMNGLMTILVNGVYASRNNRFTEIQDQKRFSVFERNVNLLAA